MSRSLPSGVVSLMLCASACTNHELLILVADPQAQTLARAELAAISPGATLEWSESLGTPDTVTDIRWELGRCESETPLPERVLNTLDEHATIFRLDHSEWILEEPFDCDEFELGFEHGYAWLRFRRTHLGPHRVEDDWLTVSIEDDGGRLSIVRIHGSYLPRVDEALEARLLRRPTLSPEEARSILDTSPVRFSGNGSCEGHTEQTPVAGCYLAQPGDTLELADLPIWSRFLGHERRENLELETDEFALVQYRSARFTVAAENLRGELAESMDNCDRPKWWLMYDSADESLSMAAPGDQTICRLTWGGIDGVPESAQ